MKKANGTVFKYGDNVDTDVIIPARYLNSSDPAVLQKTAPEAARETGIFSIFGSFTPLIIISSTGSHHVSIPCDLRCP